MITVRQGAFSDTTKESWPWETIQERSRLDPVFGSWEWAQTWMDNLLVGRDFALFLYHRNEPAGLAPLVLENVKWGGMSVRNIVPVGWSTGEYVELPVTGKDSWEALLEYLVSHPDWDVLSFRRMPQASRNALDIFSTAKSLNLGIIIEDEQVCPFLDLSGTYESYMNRRFRSKFRNRIRRMNKRLSALGEFRHEVVTDPESMDRALEAMAELESRSWKGIQGKGIFRDANRKAFYFQVVKKLAVKNMAALHLQWLDDRLLAYHYGFVAEGRYYDYNLSFDPEYGEYSPGLVSLANLLEWCFEQGLSCFDFLRGAEQYKAMWTDTATQNVNIHVFPKKGRSMALERGLALRLKARKAKRNLFPRDGEAVFQVVEPGKA